MTSETDDEPTSYPQRDYVAPPGATEVLLVRHGASAPYVPGEVFPVDQTGQGDPPLAPEGRAQAEKMADRLRHETIDALYVTSLCRTVETAAPLAAATGLEPTVEPDLREVFLGEWDGGLFRKKARDLDDPIVKLVFSTGRWDHIPGAESNETLADRCVGALARIHDRHPDGKVVSVVHGGVINVLLSHAFGSTGSLQFGGAANASISHLVLLDDKWAIRSFNDTAHLGPSFSARAPSAR